ncbi:hypothetical protein JF50_18030 [Pseudoalteromonas luteoviolacea]|uniref:Uncharacterized protein n=1 Tax=Pseudoalteromonas luteoviolacea TaxID=43657 RepID=A0A0C1QMA4_9GAMM|nr:hypothetical protein [Pseudoalteromonas luteoviolacea]KID56177.1 hypothetical protein JF50_18030 [Pseudoalteromonas luteoviolacea]
MANLINGSAAATAYKMWKKSKVTTRSSNDIELSHPANLSKTFIDPRNGTVGDLAEKMKADPSLADKISHIEVVKIKGMTYSVNNRRLRAF